MKKEWSAASMQEMDINETANGIFEADFETFIFFNKHDSNSNTPVDKTS